jgi:hypothetical protein
MMKTAPSAQRLILSNGTAIFRKANRRGSVMFGNNPERRFEAEFILLDTLELIDQIIMIAVCGREIEVPTADWLNRLHSAMQESSG